MKHAANMLPTTPPPQKKLKKPATQRIFYQFTETAGGKNPTMGKQPMPKVKVNEFSKAKLLRCLVQVKTPPKRRMTTMP